MRLNEAENKCVLIINPELPTGLIANTAAILGITLGNRFNNIIGRDTVDASSQHHLGITSIPIPILKGTKDKIKELIEEIRVNYNEELTIVDFSETAQRCNDYESYVLQVKGLTSDKFEYLGIGIFGPKKIMNKLTGSMPLLR